MKFSFANKKLEAGDVWSFFFEPVEPLRWVAGQSIRLELPRIKWGVDERRFTIASAPHEKHIQITTRISQSDFKQYLANLQPGTPINGYNVEGDFVWGESNRLRVFLAAGIGITPFRSLIADRVNSNRKLNAALLYSSSDKPPVFEEELLRWQAVDSTLKVYFLDKRISAAQLASLKPQWLQCLVYVSGPSRMVDEISKELLRHELPAAQLRRDLFTGYEA